MFIYSRMMDHRYNYEPAMQQRQIRQNNGQKGYGWGYQGISPSIEIAIAFPSPSFFPLLPNQIILFQLLKLFSFVCNGNVIIFRFGFL